MERYKTFITHDMPRILEKEWGDITEEQWEIIEPQLGLDKMRAHLIKVLNRPVTEDELLEDLVNEALERQLESHENHKQIAFFHLATQGPKNVALFYRGLMEGYELFINEHAQFCGDRGRTEVFLCLLPCMLDAEKLRRTVPKTTRPQFYDILAKVFNLPANAYGWFNDVCDDIKFPINPRPRKNKLIAATVM
jgi:hypothetical protein